MLDRATRTSETTTQRKFEVICSTYFGEYGPPPPSLHQRSLGAFLSASVGQVTPLLLLRHGSRPRRGRDRDLRGLQIRGYLRCEIIERRTQRNIVAIAACAIRVMTFQLPPAQESRQRGNACARLLQPTNFIRRFLNSTSLSASLSFPLGSIIALRRSWWTACLRIL